MKTEARVARGLKFYRVLFRLYPADFRRSFGRDAEELFEDLYREAVGRGSTGELLRFWARTLSNVLTHGPAERLARLRTGLGELVRGGLFDIGFALRSLSRSPKFFVAAGGTLALGMGASIALFTLVNGVLLRPLPFPASERLVSVWENHPESSRLRQGPSPWNFVDWRREGTGFEGMAALYLTSGTFRHAEVVEEIRSAQVTSDLFQVLGVEPAVGRGFRPEEGLTNGPVMLSHDFWQRVFQGDTGIVGSTVELSGARYEVAGVMPPGFSFPDPGIELWLAWNIPLTYADRPEARTWRFLQVVARLSPGVRAADAERGLQAVHRGLTEAYPTMNRGWTPSVTWLHDDVTGGVEGTLWAGLGAVAALLLLACTNVANLLLARAPARARELAVRSALGADRARLARQLMVEHLVLAGVAAFAASGIAIAILRMMEHLGGGMIPRIDEIGLDGTVFGFALLLTLATSLLFGLAPMLELVRKPGSALRAANAGRGVAGAGGALRRVLVSGQVGLTFVVVVGACLFMTTLDRLSDVDLGITPEETLTLRVSLDARAPAVATARRGEERTWEYYDGLLARLSQLPGVTAAGAGQTLPMDPVAGDFTRPYREQGRSVQPAEAPSVALRIVTPGYFEAVGMRFTRGAAFSGFEEPGAPLVAVVNQTLAARLWPNREPVGETFEIDFREGWQPYAVVGVVQNVRHGGPRSTAVPEVFLSHRQVPYLAMSVVLRTDRDPSGLVPEITREVLAHGPGQPPFRFIGLDELLRESTARERLLAALLGIFALFSLTLAASGVSGLVAYSVAARRREYGIRLALGDRAGRLIRSVGWGSARSAIWGLLGGLSVVALVGPLVQGQLFGIDARSPLLLGGVALGLLSLTAGAALLAARAISKVDPSSALRAD